MSYNDRINLAELSNTFQAFSSCKRSNNAWQEKHKKRVEAILEALPSGSGIDNGVTFIWDKSSPERFVFTFGYHFMNDNGYYDGWEYYRMVVTPSFSGGFDLK